MTSERDLTVVLAENAVGAHVGAEAVSANISLNVVLTASTGTEFMSSNGTGQRSDPRALEALVSIAVANTTFEETILVPNLDRSTQKHIPAASTVGTAVENSSRPVVVIAEDRDTKGRVSRSEGTLDRVGVSVDRGHDADEGVVFSRSSCEETRCPQ